MKKLCVVTGNRAEYGILKPLIDIINNDYELELQLIVTGMHLSPEFGLTYKEIENDGFKIDEKVEMLLSSDTAQGITKSMGICMIGFADSFERLSPDLVILLGDRYEVLSVASAAMVAQIPIVHLYGGETGAGTIDNMIRHAITKMSYLHFTSTEYYRKRVIQLGENPNRVFNVGSLGIENIKTLKLLSKEELEKELNFHINDRTILCTFHPLSLEPSIAYDQFNEILLGFDRIEGLRIIFTKCNSDTGGRIINDMIDQYVLSHPMNSIVFFSLGTLKYLSTVKYVKAVVGNSSSGIIEVPSLSTYTINIGKRQDGRIQCESIINCKTNRDDVYRKLNLVIRKSKLQKINNPYDNKNTSKSIIDTIKKEIIAKQLQEKTFYDLQINEYLDNKEN
ncbi:GDP/UDP-N,N'-diacetylbacillosamine 2-epimerase (hydrolyzing) [Sedimentibacter acidaminivorans]|uniref:GDP/UDP-N,N'-diacetylbacillosamine 2-epimerase (Hydrolyzing) n=1 Tax=Sedimentibacter acidaminivorans TaxID=913099 RepID=A0ABS4GDY2_9FIRM|nr:UDP-N-acetylglucosamine 2-epimerase [Sedimentibacter acidaminivorans]MBP1925707.1 GDP/UDP-N,N'-diacetylbacillosamine 2-epimerase (hydrolyzing) [Sedimentibacter acidaminivorans]